MNIPKKIKILGIVYKVKFTDDLKKSISQYLDKKDKCRDFVGYCSTAQATIYLSSHTDKQTLGSVFIHEILEAINVHMALSLKHNDIDRLETALHQVLTENNLLK